MKSLSWNFHFKLSVPSSGQSAFINSYQKSWGTFFEGTITNDVLGGQIGSVQFLLLFRMKHETKL